jgi:hypothetical protein
MPLSPALALPRCEKLFLNFSAVVVLWIFGSYPALAATEPCQVADQISTIDASRRPDVSMPSSASTGDPVSLSWKVPGSPKNDGSYLIVGFPEPTSFRGDGFVALTPKARAPHSIKSREELARLVVPLTGDLANLNGVATITFFESGMKRLGWTLVEVETTGTDTCRERTLSFGEITIDVGSGKPEILTQDVFDDELPISSYLSNDKRFLIREYASRYEVVRPDTSDALFEHAGTSPRFSYGGRFVSSYDGSGRLEILDILAQKIVFTESEVACGSAPIIILAIGVIIAERGASLEQLVRQSG